MSYSEEHWEEPRCFNPERFLTSSEENPEIPITKIPSAYLPYNFGQKSQPIMSLLEHVASNFLANIVNRFTIDSSYSVEEMARAGLGPYPSIDMNKFFTVNLHKRA